MLPTKGYFKDIDCPYHERTCGRPYCHFRHRKKAPEGGEEAATAAAAAANAAGSGGGSSTSTPLPAVTYRPTPKSELAAGGKSHHQPRATHIPISYVPDVVRAPTARKNYSVAVPRPTYRPTPKSVLCAKETAAGGGGGGGAAAVSTYTPTPIEQLKEVQANSEHNLEEEIKLLDEILTDAIEDAGAPDTGSNIADDCDILKSAQEKSNEIIAALTASSTPQRDKEKKDRRDKHRSKDDKSKDRHKDKDKDKDRKRDRHKSDRDKDRKSSSSSKTTSKDEKDKDRKSSSSRSKFSSDKDARHRKDKSSHKDKHSSSSSSKPKSEKSEKYEKLIPKEVLEDDMDFEDDLLDDDANMDLDMIEDECFRIFNEYKAPEPEVAPPPEPLKVTVPELAKTDAQQYPVGKKRVAYNNAVKDEVRARPAFKPLQSAGMTLHNRMKIARAAQAANEAQGIIAEVKSMKRTAHTQSSPSVDPKRLKSNGLPRPVEKKPPPSAPASTSLIDDILNAKSTTTAGAAPIVASKPIRRIAPASNVLSIQMAKARIDEIKNRTLSTGKTLATTVSKGAKRAAHVPDMSLSNIPDVLHADRSKLPVNVRTRYLGLLADECVKLYVSTEEAYNRALNEEFKCYERCKALPTYRNSAMLAVNRLRKEVQEREASGLGPLQLGETPMNSKESYFEGKKFYDLVKTFMLSEEEMVLHGYPREGPTPGRAVITNEYKQQVTSEHLEASQRLCCRCHKVYNINRDGFPLFEEECCYHPMRKRTIRGERMYLCCKSTEETGCAISGTHVSEVSAEREVEGFQSTFESEREDDPRDFAVYALDCEMCYTTKGLELTRVTVVNSKLKTVYEALVKPFNPIIDYNTRFSGITAELMENTTTNILQIQATILHLCTSKTILIGHSLESDMKALKIIHNSVVDTSVMFPHKFGLPHKRALRLLASEYLNKIIQNDVGGHDSAEDALAAMELVLWKVKEDLKVKGIKT